MKKKFCEYIFSLSQKLYEFLKLCATQNIGIYGQRITS